MKVFEWLAATNPNKKGTSRVDHARLYAMRARVCLKAGTNLQTLAGAKTRGAIGRGLIQRLALATQEDEECALSNMIIRWEDEVTEIAEAKAA